jgi:hypothetical protein
MFKTLYSVLNTCHFLKSSKSLHVSAWIGHPQVLILVSKKIAVSFQSCSFVPLFFVCACSSLFPCLLVTCLPSRFCQTCLFRHELGYTQPGGPGLCIYVPLQWYFALVVPPDLGFPPRRLGSDVAPTREACICTTSSTVLLCAQCFLWFSQQSVIICLTTSKQISPSWDAGSRPSTRQFPYTLCNPKDHYRVYKGPPLFSTLSQIDPDRATESHLSEIRYVANPNYINIKHM